MMTSGKVLHGYPRSLAISISAILRVPRRSGADLKRLVLVEETLD